MGYVQLAPVDREKYGAPERLPFEFDQFGLKALHELEEQTGFTLEALGKVFGTKGVRDKRAVAATVWLVLWANGIKVPWDEFDARPVGLVLDFSDGGKGQAAEATAGEADSPTATTNS